MKKYYPLLTVFIIVIVVFSTYFIKSYSLTNHYPQFRFKTVEGDEDYVENLVIQGDYVIGFGNFEEFRVSRKGTTYLRDESFFNTYHFPTYGHHVERLQNEYRSFMRGKEENINLYFENDDVLAYGNAPYDLITYTNFEFDVAVLDKQTNETTTFTIPIPERSKYWYVHVESVVVTGNKLTMMTMNDVETDKGDIKMEVHVYTFDISNKTLISDETVTELEQLHIENGYMNEYVLMNSASDGEHIILAQVQFEFMEHAVKDDEWLEEEKTIITKLMKYHVKENKMEEIPLPKEKEIGIPVAFDGEVLHFVLVKNKKLIFTNYNTVKKTLDKKLEVTIETDYLNIDDVSQALIQDNLFYFTPLYMEEVNETPLIVIDLEELTKKYEGRIENTNPEIVEKDTQVYFQSYELRN